MQSSHHNHLPSEGGTTIQQHRDLSKRYSFTQVQSQSVFLFVIVVVVVVALTLSRAISSRLQALRILATVTHFTFSPFFFLFLFFGFLLTFLLFSIFFFERLPHLYRSISLLLRPCFRLNIHFIFLILSRVFMYGSYGSFSHSCHGLEIAE
ncbi:hypothetical protein B0F90DRAFT_651663 [Multifurca ochricompacta]|uniref:Transmembrane protein n=1 Tax=Multifurca ochricompacta TaxID=376703 RepID=A0AAD4M450_9AGAM|nr:hypothetical protein B0F90DRAFT_651663 [Multifurca ochricompacta]